MRGQSYTGPWRRYEVLPTAVKNARDEALEDLAAAGIQDQQHHDDVRVGVSELVTNALRAAARLREFWFPYERPVGVRVQIRPHWTHLYVTDPSTEVPELDLELADFDDESGRGLFIVAADAEIWFAPHQYGKTAHAVLPRDSYTITDEDLALLKSRLIV